jgi:hypothetical protein
MDRSPDYRFLLGEMRLVWAGLLSYLAAKQVENVLALSVTRLTVNKDD